SGYTLDDSDVPLRQVQLSGFPEAVQSNDTGYFEAIVPKDWSGTVTPSLTDYSFSPATLTFSQVVKDSTLAQPIVGTYTKTYDISGRVTLFGSGLAGINLTVADSVVATTGEDGRYVLTVPEGWSGFIVPSSANNLYFFIPGISRYDNVDRDFSDVNYWAFRRFILSGKILDVEGEPLENVAIRGLETNTTDLEDSAFSTKGQGTDVPGFSEEVRTDSEGYFETEIGMGWSGMIVPVLENYAFEPDTLVIDSLIENMQVNQIYGVYDVPLGTNKPVDKSDVLHIFPNPASSKIEIQVFSKKATSLRISDSSGKTVKTFMIHNRDPQSILWDGRDETGAKITSGVYLCYVIGTDKVLQHKRIILIR
ncbi:MAG: T9SS type A sorting domain-containing protein, partial [Bacteroidota bacterium]